MNNISSIFSCRTIVLLITASIIGEANVACAQTTWPPLGFPILAFDQVAVAKSTQSADGAAVISIMRPQWRYETMVVTKTVYSTETKTRTVTKEVGGELVESTEEYTVEVPVTISDEISVPVFSGQGQRLDHRLSRVMATRVDGTEVTSEQLTQWLAKPKQVFVLDAGKAYRNDPFYTNMIDKTMLILFIDYTGSMANDTYPQSPVEEPYEEPYEEP
jgi:hypothetical protein